MTTDPIVIIGAGVLGLCAGFELHRRGHAVVAVDPGGPSASRVAAGMVAPAMEAAIDRVTPDLAELFRAGRDRWPEFAAAAGIRLARRPAEWRGGDADGMQTRLQGLDFEMRRDGDRILTDEDLQVEPEQALEAMKASLGDGVVTGQATSLEAAPGGWRVHVGGRVLTASAVVLATGAGAAIHGTPERTSALVQAIEPIKGQIGVVSHPLVDHVVRGPGAYVAPMGAGAVIGATMEPGRRDSRPDPEAGARLLAAARNVLGREIDAAAVEWRAGVRGATTDGLPAAGCAPDGEALFMALGPRRNGWLLGPLIGAVVADAFEGRSASPHARALDPSRF